MRTYGNTPTFNRQRCAWSKLLSGSKLSSTTQSEPFVHVRLHTSPGTKLGECRFHNYVQKSTITLPQHTPQTAATLPTLSGALLCLDRILGTSMATRRVGTRKTCGEMHIVVDAKCGERVESRRARHSLSDFDEWGKSPLSNSDLGRNCPAQSRWLASETVH
jgi:hypothetical protein